jgi:hypothetical protein
MLYNINPEKWGPVYWKMSHYITFAYPDNPSNEDKHVVKNHFDNLSNLLPCENCRGHYLQYTRDFPLTDDILSSKYKLIKWFVDFHNAVNRRLGKKEISIEKVIAMYTNNNNSNILSEYSNIIIIVLLIFLVIMLIAYMKNKQ